MMFRAFALRPSVRFFSDGYVFLFGEFYLKKKKTREENVSAGSCRDTWSGLGGAADVTKIEINCV